MSGNSTSALTTSTAKSMKKTRMNMPDLIHLIGDGVELWFGGDDTPIPQAPPEMTSKPEFTVAVAGYRPGDRVLIRYLVEGRQGQMELGLLRKAKRPDTGGDVTFL